jgi:hypothetical protein
VTKATADHLVTREKQWRSKDNQEIEVTTVHKECMVAAYIG